MNIIQIKETCLYVTDLDRTKHFYHDLLGFPIISKVEGRHVFFRAGTSVLLCFISEKTKTDTHLPPHYGYGQLHLAFEAAPEEYEACKTKVLNVGIEIIHEETWSNGQTSFYFRDFDGHLLEIVPVGIWK
ncbi:VOC family protein [Xanthocytophaga agilis]|uniref:VOC family protein n=1 Tax=Xanthocytophaga agilis TaxID=3048010 RepID=A0AAE3R546_9BACT|nr:VOC family protein [Xanthocytophaga agilis]MDJ1501762.1 VOC family protein [Xanthocytophaga agilis]